MTGSSYIAIVVPVIAFTAMAFWLVLVFYADSHPGRGGRTAGPRSLAAEPDPATGREPADDQGGPALSAGGPGSSPPSREPERAGQEVLAARSG